MRKRNLPDWYAKAFMEKAKPTFFSRTIGWEDFESVMNERESTMLRAFNSLGLSRSGMMKESDVKQSLRRLGLPATDENATAMLNHLGMNGEGYVSYGQFRNFLMLLPQDVATAKDPSVLWFEASTMVQINPPEAARSATMKLAIQAAFAGALASGSSTAMMHPMDTLKTRIQATVGAGPGMKAFLKTIPQIGARNLYRGIIPAVVGAASGHGFRTATYEVACKLLAPLTLMPLITEIQIQGFGSGLGTLVGTSVRIPCEVLKQRLQTGQHANAVEAFKAVTANGPKGLFAGTAATLSREVPFYVIGLVAYEKLKKAAATMKRKDLSAWETISLGGMAGAIAAALCEAGVGHMTIANRNVDRARDLADLLVKEFGFAAVSAQPLAQTDGADVDMIINSTSLGLHADDVLPLALDHVSKHTVIADIIMVPADTKWLQDAVSRGLLIHYGRHMLDYQIDLIGRFIAAF